jgi:hypothetical protein
MNERIKTNKPVPLERTQSQVPTPPLGGHKGPSTSVTIILQPTRFVQRSEWEWQSQSLAGLTSTTGHIDKVCLQWTDRVWETPIHVKATVFDAAISRLMTSVHLNLVQSHQYALLKTTSQRHCISNLRHDPGCHDMIC